MEVVKTHYLFKSISNEQRSEKKFFFKFYLENCVFNEILMKFGCISGGIMLKQVPKRVHHIIFKIVTWYVKV